MKHYKAPDAALVNGQVIDLAGASLKVLHTPGHAHGAACFLGDGFVFSGDTLFRGGPGATDRLCSDFPAILESIKQVLLSLPA